MTSSSLVLIIEDSPTQAQQFSMALRRRGVETIVVEDGLEGLRMVSEYRPDLVVLDINLPSMDGFQVCRRLKRNEETAHIPVIMLTVSEDFDTMMQSMETGADDYIPKDEYAIQNLILALRTLGLLDKGEE